MVWKSDLQVGVTKSQGLELDRAINEAGFVLLCSDWPWFDPQPELLQLR